MSMHEVGTKLNLARSRIAAVAMPAVAFLAGVLSGGVGPGNNFWQIIITGFAFFLVVVLACAWLMLDVRERRYDLNLWHFLGLVLVPVTFAPFYFNQTRERRERVMANILFLCTGASPIVLFWFGSSI